MNFSPYRSQPIARTTKAWAVAYEDIRYGQRHIFPTRTFPSYWRAFISARWFVAMNSLGLARIGRVEG